MVRWEAGRNSGRHKTQEGETGVLCSLVVRLRSAVGCGKRARGRQKE